MKKSILVSLTVSSMVFAGTALADGHSKGTHKGHVHKAVGGDDCCDELRRQVEDMNASNQERFEALETKVEELDELAHDHETLLLDPAPDSWSLGFDLWWPDVSGGESNFASTAFDIDGGGAQPTILSNLLRTNSDDDTAWSASVKFQSSADSSYAFKYTNLDVSTGFGPFNTFGSLTGAADAATSFIVSPAGAFAGALAFSEGVYTDVNAARDVDVDDISFERENRLWANQKFATNWSWGIRHADVDDTQTANYFNNTNTGGIGGDTAPEAATITKSSRFDGWGPSAGLKARYYLSESLELQGNVGGALLVGDQDFNGSVFELDDDNVGGVPPAFVQTVDARYSEQTVNPVMDIGSRLVWHAGDSLDLHVGYQATRYFDAIVSDFGVDTVKKDLSLDGIRAGLEFTFD